ncbi:MAG: carboxypeptidase-like regulatory domain-containing protein, partial [Duncaniella sp.]|nr:carboxypeptidase-like regulatory domain-containing protein [Duncaniella sp.]
MKCTVTYLRSIVLWLVCMTPLWAFSQNITVTGTVQDEAGDPLIGATVQQKGSGNGIATDVDGHFKLSLPKNATLVVSYVGYTTQTVAVDGRTNLTIVLKEDSEVLDEVVVVGYGQMKRSDLTGSVTSVGEDAVKKSIATSIDQVLQGRAAGVQIQANSGTP